MDESVNSAGQLLYGVLTKPGIIRTRKSPDSSKVNNHWAGLNPVPVSSGERRSWRQANVRHPRLICQSAKGVRFICQSAQGVSEKLVICPGGKGVREEGLFARVERG